MTYVLYSSLLLPFCLKVEGQLLLGVEPETTGTGRKEAADLPWRVPRLCPLLLFFSFLFLFFSGSYRLNGSPLPSRRAVSPLVFALLPSYNRLLGQLQSATAVLLSLLLLSSSSVAAMERMEIYREKMNFSSIMTLQGAINLLQVVSAPSLSAPRCPL